MRDMSMGNRGGDQQGLFLTYEQVRGPGHPFYQTVNKILREHGFDEFVEKECAKFFAPKMGRPSIPPGVYFRCLMLGYFEGIDSERGIAWRLADSLSLREFIGVAADQRTPDHSSLSRTRKRYDLETHKTVFAWVLGVLAERNLVKGKTIGVDATTLEANAAMRSIVRRDDGRTYQEYLVELAKASGIETPTRDDLARMDRKRKGRKTSNDDWYNPNDPDAQITKMKDGRTHMGHKQEHAVDMDTGAIVAVTLSGGATGDTNTIGDTVEDASKTLADIAKEASKTTKKRISVGIREVVTDKGYHSNDTVARMSLAFIRSYFSEPKRGRRRWDHDSFSQEAVYANRRRVKGERGRRLMRLRGERIERTFAHTLDTGGMRRVHLRHHENILKRVLVHTAGFNLGLLMRTLVGRGTPRGFQGRLVAALSFVLTLWRAIRTLLCVTGLFRVQSAHWRGVLRTLAAVRWKPQIVAFSTGC